MFLTTQLECCSDDARVLVFTLTSLLQRLGLSPAPCEGPSLEQQASEMVERSNQREVQLLYLRFFNILISRRKVKGEDGKVKVAECGCSAAKFLFVSGEGPFPVSECRFVYTYVQYIHNCVYGAVMMFLMQN